MILIQPRGNDNKLQDFNVVGNDGRSRCYVDRRRS